MTSPIAGTDPHSGKPRELFNVLPPPDALRRLLEHLPTRQAAEHIRTADALDRVLAEDLVSPEDLPSFPRSTMDGFAVRAADTYGASEGLPAYLDIVGEVLMGRSPSVTLNVGEAARIATGGMVPAGADAVVMIEQTQEASGSLVEVLRPVAVGENVIQIGEDVTRGAPLLARGHTLRSQDIGGLLAMGATEVPVARKARVAIISSGDEVVAPDQAPAPGPDSGHQQLHTRVVGAARRTRPRHPWHRPGRLRAARGGGSARLARSRHADPFRRQLGQHA